MLAPSRRLPILIELLMLSVKDERLLAEDDGKNSFTINQRWGP